MTDRLDAAAHNLGDEGCGIDRERQQKSHELRQDVHAAHEIESLELGHGPCHGESHDRGRQQRQPDDQAKPGPERGELLPGQVLAAARPAGEKESRHDGDNQGGRGQPEARLKDRRRHVEAAGIEEEGAEDRDALADAGQRGQHPEIPEDDLGKQRNVADHVDIGGGKRRDQEILGKARHAHDKPDDRRQHDADRRNEQRIQQADDKCAPIG